jgi:hypothetical protein
MEAMTIPHPFVGSTEPNCPRVGAATTLELVELLLKSPPALGELMRDESRQAELIPRFLAIGLIGFTIFGIAATVVLNAGPARPWWVPAADWLTASAANLVVSYDVGLVAATGVCLPSFYFYGLLAGLKISMLRVAAHSVKCLATTAVVLVGILPLYVALALGMIVFQAPMEWLRLTLGLGLALPFLAGLWGVRGLYLGFVALSDTLPPDQRDARGVFLRRLTLAWSACYTAVTPVMIASLWQHLSG